MGNEIADIVLDYQKQLDSLENTLRGKQTMYDAQGKKTDVFKPRLNEFTIQTIMFQLRTALSSNTSLSFFTPDYIKQTGHALYMQCYDLLTREMYKGNITFEERNMLVGGIDHAVMSALLRGLGGLERKELMNATKISISAGGTGGSSPTKV